MFNLLMLYSPETLFCRIQIELMGLGSVVKNLPANVSDKVLIPGSGRSSGRGYGNPLSNDLAQRIPWTEKPAGLQSIGFHRVRHY